MSIGTWIFKRRCTKVDSKRDKGNKTPDDIERFDNILYGKDDRAQILDVYRPREYDGKLPVIVSVHGGGFVYGNKEVYQYYCMSLARLGFAVLNFTYRLAPKHKHPMQLEDTNLVFAWLLSHAEEYDMDSERIYGVGDSAGATILGLYAAILTNKEYATHYSFATPSRLSLRALGLNCGIYNMHVGGKQSFLQAFLSQKGTKEELDLLSLVQHVTKQFPPCYIMTATKDYLKDEAPVLARVFDENGIKYEYKIYGTSEQPLYHVFHCDINSTIANEANKAECEFLLRQ